MIPAAEKFKAYLTMRNVTITLRTRSEGAPDVQGHKSETFANSTIYASHYQDNSSLVQRDEGIAAEVTEIIHIAVDTTISELDHVIIEGIEYICEVPDVRRTYKAVRVRRIR